MPLDPYKTLGIRKNASRATVKKAFRKAAFAAHPDRGGDAETFQAVRLSYATLSDDAKRRRYDETGEMDDGSPSREQSNVVNWIAQAFGAVMAELIKANANPSQEDMIGHLRTTLRQTAQKLQENKRLVLSNKQYLETTLGRWITEDGENIMEALVKSQLSQVGTVVAKFDEQLAVNEQALKMLKRFSFRYDPKVGMGGLTASNSIFQWRMG